MNGTLKPLSSIQYGALLRIGNFDLEKTITVSSRATRTSGFFTNKGSFNVFTLNFIIATGSVRMEAASSASNRHGNQSLAEVDLFRYKIGLKLLFAMMFGRHLKISSVYEVKNRQLLSLEVEVEKDFH